MKYDFLIGVFIFLVLLSCTKDVGTDPLLTKLTIGNQNGLIVTNYKDATSIDLDNNGSIDVTVFTERPKIMGPLYNTKVSLLCKDPSLKFVGFLKTDTLYFDRQLSYSTTKLNDTILQKNKTIDINHSCHRILPWDSIESISRDQQKLRLFSAGEEVKSGNQFVSGDFVLVGSADWLYSPAGAWPDTVTYTRVHEIRNCDAVPVQGSNYLCFTMNLKKGNKMGWIRFGGANMSIDETAITK